MRDILEKLRRRGINRVRVKEPISRHTTMRAGGAADYFIIVRSATELIDCLRVLKEDGIRFYFIGAGSNLIVSDEGFDGAIIKGGGELERIEISKEHCGADKTLICAGGAARLSELLKFATENSLYGCAFLHGIPGSVGGAIKMNAGTVFGEIGQVVERIECVNGGLNLKIIEGRLAGFSYRNSAIPDDTFITKALLIFRKTRGRDDEILMELKKKRDAQPKGLPSAGSIFKNPQSGESAGRLIDMAGLKGLSIGGAMVSDIHANFIVNTGNATSSDVLKLIIKVREEVSRRTNILLEPEVKVIGRGSLVKEIYRAF